MYEMWNVKQGLINCCQQIQGKLNSESIRVLFTTAKSPYKNWQFVSFSRVLSLRLSGSTHSNSKELITLLRELEMCIDVLRCALVAVAAGNCCCIHMYSMHTVNVWRTRMTDSARPDLKSRFLQKLEFCFTNCSQIRVRLIVNCILSCLIALWIILDQMLWLK